MSDTRTFSAELIESYAAAVRAAFAKHKSMAVPGFQRDLHVATARLAAEAARNFTNKRADKLALRLDALEEKLRDRDSKIADRDDQIKRHAEHLHRLQTKVATLELLAKK